MDTLSQLLDSTLADVHNEDEKALKCKEMILPEIESGEERVPLDMQIEATLQQLEKVKQQHRYLRTKELFLERILESQSVEEVFPPSNEIAQLEMALGGEKQKLRSTKASRQGAEKRLASAAGEFGVAMAGKEKARQDAESLIQRAKIAVGLQLVRSALQSGDESELDRLAQNARDLDQSGCRLVLEELRAKRTHLEVEHAEQSQKTEVLRAEVQTLEKDVAELESSNATLQVKISESDKENSEQADIRQECIMQEQLGDMLSALTGIRVAEVRRNGMTFEIKGHAFLPVRTSSAQKTCPDYKLDVEFGRNKSGANVVSFMYLTPSDVNVGDIREDLGLSLESGVQKVCSRLAKFVRENR